MTKLPLFALLVLSIAPFAGQRSDMSPVDLMEYNAVSADGPYSYLPAGGIDQMMQANVDDITPEEALMIDARLSALADAPLPPATPLDGPALSDSEILLAGL